MSLSIILTVLFILYYIIATLAIVHCLLHSKYPQGALAWCGVIFMLPAVGAFLYFIFGVNRIDSRAAKLFTQAAEARHKHLEGIRTKHWSPTPTKYSRDQYPIMGIGERSQGLPCMGGNTLEVLFNGDEAYPKMLEAINAAQKYIFLSTYIFSGKKSGERFVEALINAHKRGIMVKVIVDGLGTFLSFTLLHRKLKKAGIPVYFFIPFQIFPFQMCINLRNHRKLLICDDIAFTGGMNISDDNLLKENPRHAVQDVHFKCTGPIVMALREGFLLDLAFVTNQQQNITFSICPPTGTMDARLIMDGPGNDDDLIINLLCGVFSSAKKEITIVNPYFLPTREIISALMSAVTRGVRVRVILPEKLDHNFVAWAGDHILPGLINGGIKIYKQPRPFAHTKLVLIDDIYTFLGSTNFDPRSLKLNFELNLEVFSLQLNSYLGFFIESIVANSKEISALEFENAKHPFLGLLKKLRNAGMWIFSPYL